MHSLPEDVHDAHRGHWKVFGQPSSRRVLITAHTLGYYDIPKKIGLLQLAKRLDLSRSTVDMQLRRAERRLLNHIINES